LIHWVFCNLLESSLAHLLTTSFDEIRSLSVKGQTAGNSGELGTATIGAAVGQGLFHSRRRFVASVDDSVELAEESRQQFAAGYRPFSRRVGLRYSVQVILNSLPLLYHCGLPPALHFHQLARRHRRLRLPAADRRRLRVA
jgi:hypothetical protein